MKFSSWLVPSCARLGLSASLLFAACGDDAKNDRPDGSTQEPGDGLDASRSDGGARDAARDAQRPAPTDDAAASDGSVDTDPADSGAASLDAEIPDAGSNELDAELPDTGVVVVEPDTGLVVVEPDAGVVVVVPDAGTPVDPVCDPTIAPSVDNLAFQAIVNEPSLANLTYATQAPGSADWYLVEMTGRIMRFSNGALDPTPFLDLRSAISLGAGYDQTTISYDERGLLGLEFAPDYQTSGLFYVAVTPSAFNFLGLPQNHDMVVEYRSIGGAAPVLSRILVDAPSAAWPLGNIHNMNTVKFGPDGLLYVGMGDGGGVNCGDAEPNASQDVGSVFGKMLRLDLTRPAPYGAADNPFVADGDPRVLHYGLRNPFRFSFDRLNGDLYLGDVGQSRYEEANYAPAAARGLNFGWATFEGNAPCPTASRPLRAGSTATAPIFVADRQSTNLFDDYAAITGGVVYRGQAIPALVGTYLFGDYYGKRLAALKVCGGQVSPFATLRKVCDPNSPEKCLRAPAGGPQFRTLTAVVEDHEGELYFVASGNSLLKLVPR